MNFKNEICKAFNKAAKQYETAAKIQNEIGLRLFERLDYLKINPQRVLDLGCGSGFFLKQLKQRYPNALVVGIDLSELMLANSKQCGLVAADMDFLPFANNSFDLIFSNQVLHWSSSLELTIRELNRVMSTEACLMFSTLGPDTFIELRAAWQNIDNYAHVNTFIDMHNIGDILMQEQFLDPVMDTEFIYAHFLSLESLLQSLKNQGVKNINRQRRKTLTGKNTFKAFKKAMQNYISPEKKFPLSYEVVYGHAWKGKQRKTAAGTETFFSVDDLLNSK